MSAEKKPFYLTDSKGMVIGSIKYEEYDDCYTLKAGRWIEEEYPLFSDAISRAESIAFKFKVFREKYNLLLFGFMCISGIFIEIFLLNHFIRK